MNCTFPLALTFLTKLPWPWKGEAAPQDLARAMFWFPWVGAVLGLIFWGAWKGLLIIFPPAAAAALLLTLAVVSTGGLHLDGLADTADGLGGGHNPADRLRIMKDSRLGAFGVLSLILVLLLKFAFLLSAAERGMAGGSIVLFPVVSRWGMVLLAYLAPYARREGGLGQAMTDGVSPRVTLGATAGALALALAAMQVPGVVLMGWAAFVVWLANLYFRKRLGGVTGDALGAANEVLEVLVLGGALLFL